MEALRSFSSCLARQINEAVRITSSSATIIMNSKSEFHQAPIGTLRKKLNATAVTRYNSNISHKIGI